MASIGKEEILNLLLKRVFSGKIINNSHRGDLVEIMVLAALGKDWELVGLGWHPWDLQKGTGKDRVRLQVKQAAALQIWGETKHMSINFGWKEKKPRYFERDNPNEPIEEQGYFCELIVVGLHLEVAENECDQVDPKQWLFSVIPTATLKHETGSMRVPRIMELWPPVKFEELRERVESVIGSLNKP